MVEFKLRPLKNTDAKMLAYHANNENIARYLMDSFPYPYTIQHARQFIKKAKQHRPVRNLAITIQDQPIGMIGVHPLTDIRCTNAELGYWIAEPHWGQGIGTKVVKEMVQYSFLHFDVDRIFAITFGNNPASSRVLEKAGFTLEAHLTKSIIKRGEKLDELIYAIRKN